jgi:hypothetical protein
MAIQLPLSDRYGNNYPLGYRRWKELHIYTDRKVIVALFEDWKDEESRNTPGLVPFRIVDYNIGPNRVPAVLSYNGTGSIDEDILNSMGILVLRNEEDDIVNIIHNDVNFNIDKDLLESMGITILVSVTPSYDDFAGPDNANPSGVGSSVYWFVKTRPENQGAIDI